MAKAATEDGPTTQWSEAKKKMTNNDIQNNILKIWN